MHGVGVRGVGAAARLEDELVHPGEAAEDQVEPVDELEHALQRLVVLVGVQLRDLGPRDELPGEPRVVLHRAGAEEADAHHPERLLREMEVVAQDLGLGQLGQLGRRVPAQRLRERARPGRRPRPHLGLDVVEDDAAPARPAHLHHERLVPDGRVVAAVIASTSFSAVDEPVDVRARVHLGDAVEGALAELREVGREVLAAEDPALAKRAVHLGDRPARLVEVDDELLEESVGEQEAHAVELGRGAGRRSGCCPTISRPTSANPSGPISAM